MTKKCHKLILPLLGQKSSFLQFSQTKRVQKLQHSMYFTSQRLHLPSIAHLEMHGRAIDGVPLNCVYTYIRSNVLFVEIEKALSILTFYRLLF